MAKVANVRGLRNYIQELRNCSSKEQEKERVDKELGKIRKKYTSDKAMSAYDKRKYMWKLLYTHMLGYDVDFGHKQAMDLIAASGYAEKQVGYVACAMFLSERDEFLRLVINSVRNDLISRNEAFQCLALDFIANVGGAEFAQLLTGDVMAVLDNGAVRPVVRKKAALCLLRLVRKAPPEAEVLSPGTWGPRLAALLGERDMGLLLGATTLLLGVAARGYAGYECCVAPLVAVLERCRARDVAQDYTYYGLASPWLQVKALRALQYFPAPADPAVAASLRDCLKRTLGASEPVKNANKNNAVHAIVFEAVAVALALDDTELLTAGVALLARFLAVREPNLRYLALEALSRLASVPEVGEAVGRAARTVRDCLADPDVSIARRALGLLFVVATPATAPGIVDELLAFLPQADYALREELVLKTAVLAERFLPSLEWYVDGMLTLMQAAGEFAIADLWQSVVHLVTNSPELHAYAAGRVYDALAGHGALPETFVKAAAHILGEYGALLPAVTPCQIFDVLHAHYPAVGPETKAILLTSYGKLSLAAKGDEELQRRVATLLDTTTHSADPELQQRALEYTGLIGDAKLADAAIQPMPVWEGRSSLLIRRLEAYEGEEGADEGRERPSWLAGGEDGGAGGAAAQTTPKSPLPNTPGLPSAALSQPGTAKPSVAVPDLLDLLELGEPSVVTPAPGVVGLAGLLDDAGMVPTPSAAPVPAAASPNGSVSGGVAPGITTPGLAPAPAVAPTQLVSAEQLAAWSRRLWTGTSGVLYEDANLQIGVKSAFTGSTGSLTFFLGNKTAVPLQGVAMDVVGLPGHLSFSMDTVPAVLEPRRQVQVPATVQARGPGLDPVKLRVEYLETGGGTVAATQDLPLPPAKFSQPVDVPAGIFSARWAQVQGPPFKLSVQVRPSVANRKVLEAALAAMRLRLLPFPVQGVPDSAVPAAAVLHLAPPAPGGSGRQVPCMVLADPAAASITVAAADAAASAAVLQELDTVLSWDMDWV